ncbi:mitochondrial inner membrane protein-domain-containing protein [Spinellus fusiger]|nr:mitochondrial inner membrane protein-domain-containing protein [Spinellus fusiger]
MLRGASVLNRSTATVTGRSIPLSSCLRNFSTARETSVRSPGKKLLWTALLTTTAYSGATFYALKNKTFYDTYITHVPGGEHVVDFLEDLAQNESLHHYAAKACEWKDTAATDMTRLKEAAWHAKQSTVDLYEQLWDAVDDLRGQPTPVNPQGPVPLSRHTRSLRKEILFANVLQDSTAPPAAFSSTGAPTGLPTVDALAKTMAELVEVLNQVGMPGHARRLVDFATRDLALLVHNIQHLESNTALVVEQTTALLQLAEQLKLHLAEHQLQLQAKVAEAKQQGNTRIEDRETAWQKAFDVEHAALAQQLAQEGQRVLDQQRTVHLEALEKELTERALALQKEMLVRVQKQVEEERGGRLSGMDHVVARQSTLERLACDNAESLDVSRRALALLVGIEAVGRVAFSGNRPAFLKELTALVALSTPSTPFASVTEKQTESLVKAVALSISKTVAEEGVDSMARLVERFDVVSREVREASLIPEQDSSLLSHVISIIMSKFLFPKEGWVEGEDIEARLARAKYHLDHTHDLESAAREMNQLKGWPKTLASDWLMAARRHLEVKQALEALRAQAALTSMLQSA